MNIHEYQAKDLLRSFGVPVPPGVAVGSPAEAREAARQLDSGVVVVKAQIHAGGRGAGRYVGEPACGGVRLVKTPEDAQHAAFEMLDRVLVTKQTGPEGRLVRKLYIEAGSAIEHEYYLSILLDREARRIVIVASSEGGMSIEDVAAEKPESIHKSWIDPTIGLSDHQSRDLAVKLGFTGKQIAAFAAIVRSAYTAFTTLDASLLEVNPLALTKDGALVVLDAKMSFDENGLFRHANVRALRDPDEEDPREQEAARFGLSYVGLDGTIGCMVNGAGLAMATMDIINSEGESPANFLDVGGGASREKVAAAFRILLADPNVEGVLVNIFGGIMRCDIIAEAVVSASREVGLHVPLVVRLAGTNVEEGMALIENSGLDVTVASDLADAARKIVAAVRARRAA
ncbi:ADP-forming succinate--CoA ligase subunit beta [Acidomonas methanolica]|uniref:Succinate--CoA ligase [ADP-forming] subunit beta n=1 Tax=Acidomonas methanolica NBRC 104435 TaxID=1231351 RepID=A0A023D6T8_ACIMT|nr:ADP-forming succinate--CoA ligase subunit beta [Acidomonas methanolica]MBU2655300.1 ADP-forming succinate--CoA ligase subunit beta [Acidomonas methanolica]MCQ9155836.1 ADP-forming succinate--CoA ligase subunit beta [Acidomonas methanolica]TCS23793.1 succinyl-CoA synthetase beta subunit [Acidomonas methanolica]GAJ29863.1 succinyl-CoA synthetase subunit beta [Acidomonas methanolica NBRC 104435]GBQ53316.1 succinyl-CoA synthetase subunit beta [Acidomonas methanolica]